MKKMFKSVLATCVALAVCVCAQAGIWQVRQINNTTVEVVEENGVTTTIDFYGKNIFRLFQDPKGGIVRDPVATPPAQILVNQPRKCAGKLSISEDEKGWTVETEAIAVKLCKATGGFCVADKATGKTVISKAALTYSDKGAIITLAEEPSEYFYGGGVQNGRFSHKGTAIQIVNTNNWTDGGVASPTPFYWSTGGYSFMWHTFAPGKYDFGAAEKGKVTLTHEIDYIDVFFSVSETPVALLNDFYQLTGHPVLLPKFGFYEGHLNAYNRDYWKEVEDERWDAEQGVLIWNSDNVTSGGMTGKNGGILFEDGKFYKESQTDNGGIKESLNGEKNNYQFSARAVIDRYIDADMPLGWILVNDGYGAGYGQTGTLEGNVQNLKEFGDYARSKGVEMGLWTQSDLHPKEGIEALLQRDIVREVRDAGVRVLKTDVAWVGAGYSFGLNGVADVGQIMPYYGNDARPFIISLDGWAGTQRYAGIWTGDQTGGEWEYIRFHIPTYIGSGLSGQPNICSDMDGIFGGRNVPVNVRDFQWKTFSPMQLNMDGWGSNPKYPQALGGDAVGINRAYLKLKSCLMPYTYSIAHEAIDGKPMIRAMFLDYPNEYTLGTATRYQFMYGPYILVAPIYQDTKMDADGNDVRNGIYLPEGEWVDANTGKVYKGNRIINNYPAPLEVLPFFIKRGAIIPEVGSHNTAAEYEQKEREHHLQVDIFPGPKSSFTEYDDDGRTQAYLHGQSASTVYEQELDANGKLTIVRHATKGNYKGLKSNLVLGFSIQLNSYKKITIYKNGKKFAVLPSGGEKSKKTAEIYMAKNGGGRLNLYRPFSPLKAEIPSRFPKAPKAPKVETIIEVTDDADCLDANEETVKPDVVAEPVAQEEETTTVEEKVVDNQLQGVLVRVPDVDIYNDEVKVVVEGVVLNTADPLLKSHGALAAPKAEISDENTAAYTVTPTWEKVENADYYEIEFGGMLYSTITDTELLFEDLQPVTDYSFKLRAVNADGVSEWTTLNVQTKPDPLRLAIRGIRAETTCKNQGGQGIDKLFDFDESKGWHTDWSNDPQAVPFDAIIDLRTVNVLSHLHYLPRHDAGNGTLMRGTIAWSMDKTNWHDETAFNWARNGEAKLFEFKGQPTARYIKLHVDEAVGNFGSGQEMYIFRVDGSDYYIPGDVNHDGRIDENDLTSYMNYTGLRTVDPDFQGYMNQGDLDNNGMIDVYDISTVAIELESGVSSRRVPTIEGEITVAADKKNVKAGEEVKLTVSGKGMVSVNAIGMCIPYDATVWEYVGIDANTKEMRNLTYDRLHADGKKALYPTFVNCGEHPYLEGDATVMTITFRAKQATKVELEAKDVIVVDKYLNKK